MLPAFPQRRSIRLPEFDYSAPNYYFITICTAGRRNIFGYIKEGKIVLNNLGKIVEDELLNLRIKYNNIEIDKYVIMPDHSHFIIIFDNERRGAVSAPVRPSQTSREITRFDQSKNERLQTGGETPPQQVVKLGNVIGYFKYQSTKKINLINQTPGQSVWQRNYYEHIIRDDKGYDNIWNYIDANPDKWEFDRCCWK